jgi:hypothetical protein
MSDLPQTEEGLAEWCRHTFVLKVFYQLITAQDVCICYYRFVELKRRVETGIFFCRMTCWINTSCRTHLERNSTLIFQDQSNHFWYVGIGYYISHAKAKENMYTSKWGLCICRW